jgi:hypothetical protein
VASAANVEDLSRLPAGFRVFGRTATSTSIGKDGAAEGGAGTARAILIDPLPLARSREFLPFAGVRRDFFRPCAATRLRPFCISPFLPFQGDRSINGFSFTAFASIEVRHQSMTNIFWKTMPRAILRDRSNIDRYFWVKKYASGFHTLASAIRRKCDILPLA